MCVCACEEANTNLIYKKTLLLNIHSAELSNVIKVIFHTKIFLPH